MELGVEDTNEVSPAEFYGHKKLPNLDTAAHVAVSCSSNNVDIIILPPDPDQLTTKKILMRII